MNDVSRRAFLSATAGAVGVASIGELGTMATSVAAAESTDTAKEKTMRVGMLTVPFKGETLETVAKFAKEANIAAMEVYANPGSTLLDPTNFDAAQADAVKKLVSDYGVEISSLACYDSITDTGETEKVQANLLKMIDAAVLLNVPTICTMTGYPVEGMSKIATIKKVVKKAFEPVVAHAKEKGINIAIENYFETCLQGIDTFECLFESIKDENFGLNYDPSHLYHQQINHLLPVKMFPKRIFHSHGKDTLVDIEKRSKIGIYAQGWWRYVLPGYGNINWGEYISHLRMAGYSGVISIEHEDNTFDREQGFIHAARYLNQFC